MLEQDLMPREDRCHIRVNRETEPVFYFFDYDTRTADVNMQFQHLHPFYEMCVMLCPRSIHFLEGKPYELHSYDIFCVPPRAFHKTQYPPGAPCKRLIIQFSLPENEPGLGPKYTELLSMFHQERPIFRFERELQETVFRKLNDIFLPDVKTDPMRDLRIHIRFVEFLTLLYLNRENNRYSDKPQMCPTEEKIYSVANYIHSHYAEELSLSTLSRIFYVSRCYLSRQFKRVTGFTVTDYIQMTRVRNIQSMLANTDIPIAQVAADCGFTSFSQFNRTFQKHTDTSPSQYRRKMRAGRYEADG